jgi:hypothetical protein
MTTTEILTTEECKKVNMKVLMIHLEALQKYDRNGIIPPVFSLSRRMLWNCFYIRQIAEFEVEDLVGVKRS